MNIFSSNKQKILLVSILFMVLFLFYLSNVLAKTSQETTSNYEKKISYNGKYYWVIYDSVCPYCLSAKKYIKALDWEGKFMFISYRDPLTYKMFPELTKEECEKDVHMVTTNGQVLVGYKVFRTIIDNLTATKVINPFLRNKQAEEKLNEIYEKMVQKRSCYYNKTETCDISKKN